MESTTSLFALAAEDAAAVAILERALTERLNAHRRHLDDLDDQVDATRDDLGRALNETNKRLGAMETQLATIATIAAQNTSLVNKLFAGGISLGVLIIGAAATVILLGPSPP